MLTLSPDEISRWSRSSYNRRGPAVTLSSGRKQPRLQNQPFLE